MVGAKDNDAEPFQYQKQIKALYVDPDMRRQAIGSALLNAVFDTLKRRKVDNAMLWCIKSNEAACAFYEKHSGRRIENISPPEAYSAVPHLIYAWHWQKSEE